MRALLDVNVLIALLDTQHAAYEAAHEWFKMNRDAGWASCPLTENGCLRLLTNPRYKNPLPPAVVLSRLQESKDGGHHEFWPDDLSITDEQTFDWTRLRGHQQITDIYLLALAVAHGGRLVTFDQRIQRAAVLACGAEHLVML